MSSNEQSKAEKNAEAVMAKIAEWPPAVRKVGQRLHEVIMSAEPDLKPRIWYGMPGYAKSASAPVLMFFRHDEMYTFGLTEKAHLEPESGNASKLMPSAWFFVELDEATEKRIASIVRQAVS